MLIAEELLLLALDPVRGTVVNSAGTTLKVGLAGALVAELGLEGAVEVQGRRFAAVGAAPGHPLLAAALQALQGSGRRSSDQLRRLDRRVGGLWPALVDGMVDGGVLGRRRDRVLLVPVTRHPVLQAAPRDEALARVRAAAAADGPLEPRTAVLLALSGPCRLLEVVAPERSDRGHAKRRIAEAAELTPVAAVVKRVISEAQAAATAGAAVAASTAATSG